MVRQLKRASELVQSVPGVMSATLVLVGEETAVEVADDDPSWPDATAVMAFATGVKARRMIVETRLGLTRKCVGPLGHEYVGRSWMFVVIVLLASMGYVQGAT